MSGKPLQLIWMGGQFSADRFTLLMLPLSWSRPTSEDAYFTVLAALVKSKLVSIV